jgi:ABC-type transport system substrate-binding protein
MKKLLLFVLCLGFVVIAASCNNNSGNQGGNEEHKHTPCPECGLCTDSKCDGEKCEGHGPKQPWYETDGDYTYNDFIGGTTSMNWNPLSWETNDDSYVLGYLSMGFYDYALNEDGDGWVVVPEMAAELPTDVTAQYVGKFGVEAGEKGKAWEIKLNPAAVWEDGTPITTEDYIYSMKQQLDPVQLNRRADSFYGGDFSLVNAKNYVYSEQEMSFVSVTAKGYETVAAALAAGETVYLDVNNSFGVTDPDFPGAKQNGALLPINDTVSAVLGGSTAAMYAQYEALFEVGGDYNFCINVADINPYYHNISFEEVGMVAVDDYTLVLIIENELANPDFYLPYYLSSWALVNEELFENCWIENPDGTKTNNYMTSLDTSISFGPYRLSYFEADKQITFTRNPNWYGYTDGKHEGQFQTDKISCQVITEHKTALLAFLAGEIDGVGMDAEDMEVYGGSKYLLYSPESYTTKFTINTDLASLQEREEEGYNKAILTVKEFRKAFSLCLDRAYFTSAFTASHAPGYGLVNYMYQVILENGTEETYRNYDAAKEALCNLYDLTWGEGGEYDTLEDAYAAITGFDMAGAKEAMAQAYAIAKEKDLYEDGEIVKIRFSVYSTDDIYKQMYEYVRGQLEQAAAGTPLEGKIQLEMFADADYYNSLYAGATDVIFSTWGGATYGTLGLLSNCYCDDYTGGGNQMEVGFNTDNVPVKFTIDGKEITTSLKQWADWLNVKAEIEGLGKAADYSVELRVELLGKLEEAYLDEWCAIPLYYRQGASLHSQKVEYGADEYVNLIGYGGIRHMTYVYTDQEWKEVVAKGLTY